MKSLEKISSAGLCVLVSLVSLNTWAAGGEKPENPVSLSNIPNELAAPWATPARPWLLGGAGLTGVLVVLKKQVGDPIRTQALRDRPLGTSAKYGDYAGQVIPNAIYSLAMLGDWMIRKDSKSLGRSVLMAKATLYAASWTTMLKYVAGEPRPNDGSNHKSFPSGHATTIFAFAAFIGAEHPLPYGIAAYSLAAFTGYSRINDDKHFLHDVVGGATIGISYGLGMSYLYQKREEASRDSAVQKEGISWEAAPVYSPEFKGGVFVVHY